MSPKFTKISRPFSEAGSEHQILVVGSGYGGGVAAARLARAGQQVTLLERGREVLPGEYPRDMAKGTAEFRINTRQKAGQGNADGLFELHVGDDVSVLVGQGLGGTSLINANVAIEPDKRVYATWPEPYKSSPEVLDEGYALARKMLGSKPYPEGKSLPIIETMEAVAKGLDAPFVRPEINVTFKDGFNAQGVFQSACTDCGDCVSGCNYGAKNTTLMNYLPDAKAHGAEIFTRAEVRSIAKCDGGTRRWLVTVVDRESGESRTLTADYVILAAGTLGSTEILKRSDGLALSDQLGKRFTGNGDVWAFGYNANRTDEDGNRLPVYGVGAGLHEVSHGPTSPEDRPYKPGPCITAMVDLRPGRPLEDGLIIESGVMPGALAPGYATLYPAMNAMLGDLFRFGDTDVRLQDVMDLAKDITDNPLEFPETVYTGPVSRTLPYLVMSHDAGDGELTMHADHISVTWPDAGLDPAIVRDADALVRASDTIQAEYMPTPVWTDGFGNRLVSVHPMGGCVMGTDHMDGVVNADCAVFDPGCGLHEGLFVCDGAVIPTGLGVNPHLTITAVAERAMAELIKSEGWDVKTGDVPPPMMQIEPPAVIDDMLATLREVIAGLSQLQQAINGRAYELAQNLLRGLWRSVQAEFPKSADRLPSVDKLIDVLGDADGLRVIVEPTVAQVLDVIGPIPDLVDRSDYLKLLSHIEGAMGDFSPQLTFFEKMVGHVSDVGITDEGPLGDPYAVAAAGPDDCVMTGKIIADHVRGDIMAPNGAAKIKGGTFTCPSLDGTYEFEGTFRFFQPDLSQVETWLMIYEGPLTKDGSPDLHFKGVKTLQRREGSDWWTELNTLDIDITDGEQLVARGRLKLRFDDLIEQVQGLTVEYDFGDLYKAQRKVRKKLTKVFNEDPKELPALLAKASFRVKLIQTVLIAMRKGEWHLEPSEAEIGLTNLYKARALSQFAILPLRTYGGLLAYLWNFPSKDPKLVLQKNPLPTPEVYWPEVAPNAYVKLTRYRERPTKGPVLVAGGFGTKASSFAMDTVDENFTHALIKAGYEVWLFDYRGSGDNPSSLDPFTIDDVAAQDWPAAFDLVTNITKAEKVPVVVHCIASVSLFMAVLRGETRVKSIISSQIATHPITNYFKFAQADAELAGMFANGVPKSMWPLVDTVIENKSLRHLAKHGMPIIDPRSPSDFALFDRLFERKDPETDAKLWETFNATFDTFVYNVPSFAQTPCYSPTCHRITFIFGPSYTHDNLNQYTHNAIADVFGPLSTRPFQHIAKMFKAGKLVSDDGSFDYMAHHARLDMPIHFISGVLNQEMLPEATLRSLRWLQQVNKGVAPYSRHVFQGYGHMDTFIGKDASRDIFPHLIERLEATR